MQKPVRDAIISTVSVYLTTSLHHAYGAWIYDTPWRNHIITQGGFWLILSLAFLAVYQIWKKKAVAWIFVVFAGFFFVGAIGLYEGLYNHLLKNILFFAGISQETMQVLFPPPTYEMPNDVLFEATGMLTLVISLWCGFTFFRFIKSIRNE